MNPASLGVRLDSPAVVDFAGLPFACSNRLVPPCGNSRWPHFSNANGPAGLSAGSCWAKYRRSVSLIAWCTAAGWENLGTNLLNSLNISQIIINVILFLTGTTRWPGLSRGAFISLYLAIYLMCSAGWSIDPGATIRAGIPYFFFILGLIGVAKKLDGDDFMRLLASVCFLSAVVCLIFLFMAPDYAIGETGDFHGIFSQKNLLGQAMAVGALACLHGLRVGTRSRLSGIAMFLVITFTAFKSKSATSYLVILIFLLIAVLSPLMRRREVARTVSLIALTLLLVIVPIVAENPNSLFELFGKDATLTGRTDVWGYVIPYIYQRPWLGWGYAAFWSTGNPVTLEIANALHWYVPEAHNGLLEILLSSGLVGAVWFIYLWVRTFRLSLRSMRYDSAMATTCFSCCVGVLVEGVSEHVLVYLTGFAGAFFITGFYCEQAVSRTRRRHPVAAENLARPPSAHLGPSSATAKF